jgi:hypothetical protein
MQARKCERSGLGQGCRVRSVATWWRERGGKGRSPALGRQPSSGTVSGCPAPAPHLGAGRREGGLGALQVPCFLITILGPDTMQSAATTTPIFQITETKRSEVEPGFKSRSAGCQGPRFLHCSSLILRKAVFAEPTGHAVPILPVHAGP